MQEAIKAIHASEVISAFVGNCEGRFFCWIIISFAPFQRFVQIEVGSLYRQLANRERDGQVIYSSVQGDEHNI